MNIQKNVALVAHDNRKNDLVEWVEWNDEILAGHNLICTGTTGMILQKAFDKKFENGEIKMTPKIKRLKSGPLGGDQQLGSMIVDGQIDCMIFFWDPMQPHPHDVDVKALLRIAVLYNLPIACNRSTADFMISSPLMQGEYTPTIKDYSSYINRYE
ncbi:MAG: methylglyoxal synthase [Deferribacteres bacterium]|nr:methylglyoxal synthase [candidate division KSB1 bacterium]MCB9502126.1 methylglyoxal synthase [Deferribacteres bacterium]